MDKKRDEKKNTSPNVHKREREETGNEGTLKQHNRTKRQVTKGNKEPELIMSFIIHTQHQHTNQTQTVNTQEQCLLVDGTGLIVSG